MILDLDKSGVHVKELKRFGQLALHLDEDFSVEDLVELPVKFVAIRLQLVCFLLDMISDLLEG